MPILDYIKALASPVAGIGSSILNYLSNQATNETNLQLQREANQNNRQIAEEQRQWDLDMWNRQNAYNDPSAQVARLRAAGINPGLAYVNGGMMNEAAQAQPAAGSRDIAARMQPYFLDPLTAAQIANLDAQTQKTKAETKTEDQLREARYRELTVLADNMEKQSEDIVSKIQQRAKQNELTDAEIDNIKFDQMLRDKQFGLDKQRLENETNLTKAQIDDLNADKDKKLAEAKVSGRQYDEMVWTFAIRKAGLEEQVNLTKAQIEQANATAYKLGVESRQIEQLINISTPDELRSARWTQDMSGGNGKFDEIGSTLTYEVLELFKSIARVVLK